MHRRSAGRRYGSTQLESPAVDPPVYPDRLPGDSAQQPGEELAVASAQLESPKSAIPPQKRQNALPVHLQTRTLGAPQSVPAHAPARARSSTRLGPI